VNVESFLIVLPGGYVEEAQMQKCTTEEINKPSSFIVDLIHNRRVLPFENR